MLITIVNLTTLIDFSKIYRLDIFISKKIETQIVITESTFVKKILTEQSINTSLHYVALWSISSTFYAQIFRTKVLWAAFFYLHVPREKLPKRLSYEKGAHKMLMKLTL